MLCFGGRRQLARPTGSPCSSCPDPSASTPRWLWTGTASAPLTRAA